jgi:hypothetical protein
MDPNHPYEELLSKGQVFIRSNRLLERRSRKRTAPKASSSNILCSVASSKKKEKSKKIGRVLDPDEPFKLFLRDRETTEFLSAKEERHLFSQIQACLNSLPLIPQRHFQVTNLALYIFSLTESYETGGGSAQVTGSVWS